MRAAAFTVSLGNLLLVILEEEGVVVCLVTFLMDELFVKLFAELIVVVLFVEASDETLFVMSACVVFSVELA